MVTTLTMPDNLDALVDAAMPPYEDDLSGQVVESPAPEAAAEASAEALLESITGQSLDSLCKQMDTRDGLALPEKPTRRLTPAEDFVCRYVNARQEARRAESEMMYRKEEYKAAKDKYAAKLEVLKELEGADEIIEAERKDHEERPLLNNLDEPSSDGPVAGGEAETPVPASPPAASQDSGAAAISNDESAQEYQLANLSDLSDGTIGALHNANIETIGQLAEWTIAGQPLTSIPKIGKAKAEQIKVAMEKFWKERPDRKQP